jgi:WD40 repeat protein
VREVKSLLFSADGKMLAAAGGSELGVRIWDTATGKERGMLKPGSQAESIAFAPDSKTLATGHADGLVRLWDTATWRERANLPAHREPILYVAISADGKSLATTSRDGSVKLWNVSKVGSLVTARK